MQGFFSKKETQSTSRPDGKVLSCASCGLYRNGLHPKMKPFGENKKGIMNIGDAPDETDDKRGKPWQGKTGRLLQKTYRDFGIDLFEDCINLNAVNCRPIGKNGYNRPATTHEINCCRRLVLKAIKEYQPKLIMVYGKSAIDSLIGHRWNGASGGIQQWRGWTIPDQDYKAWVCPTFHPSFVDQAEGKEVRTIWRQDIERAFQKLDEPWYRYKEPKIEVIDDLSVLDTFTAGLHAFDYETTGLKPHARGHRIVSCAVADTENHCYTFLMPKTKKELMPFFRWLQNKQISKMAHNMKFEEAWSVNTLRQYVAGWEWDSMLAAHLLDNRSGVTGLKFQTYVNFGVVDYASDVDQYLKGAGNSSNDFNRVEELLKTKTGVNSLLKYNALDAVYEYRLAQKQMKIMDYSFLPF